MDVHWKIILAPQHKKKTKKQKNAHFAFRFSGHLPERNLFLVFAWSYSTVHIAPYIVPHVDFAVKSFWDWILSLIPLFIHWHWILLNIELACCCRELHDHLNESYTPKVQWLLQRGSSTMNNNKKSKVKFVNLEIKLWISFLYGFQIIVSDSKRSALSMGDIVYWCFVAFWSWLSLKFQLLLLLLLLVLLFRDWWFSMKLTRLTLLFDFCKNCPVWHIASFRYSSLKCMFHAWKCYWN